MMSPQILNLFQIAPFIEFLNPDILEFCNWIRYSFCQDQRSPHPLFLIWALPLFVVWPVHHDTPHVHNTSTHI